MSSKAQMISVCGHCGKQCERRACKQCRMIAYCSAECQKADWPKHKKNCATMAETKSPEETEIFNQSKRFMALVDTVYYDGRREDPSLYRHHLEHMIASYLQLQDDPYSMRVTPIVEINWGLVPMNIEQPPRPADHGCSNPAYIIRKTPSRSESTSRAKSDGIRAGKVACAYQRSQRACG
ncbi:hypothetical protein PENSPDRAFT_209593 [Peniophora sp. CONT]|nr:hypothetical protein PENSPDRAFT_209593 [Peniophora sp. CONT]